METHEIVNDVLIATLTNAHVLCEDNLSIELWTGIRHLELRAPWPDKPLTDPIPVSKSLTKETVHASSTDTLNVFIAERMSEVGKVERVYANYKAQIFYTWIVIEERDREVQKAIYEREKRIINRFSDMRFDFYIIYRSGEDPDTIVSGVELVYDRDNPK